VQRDREESLMLRLDYSTLSDYCKLLARALPRSSGYVYGIPRGGSAAALLFALCSDGRWVAIENPDRADLILDDIYDSGATIEKSQRIYPRTPHAVLINKSSPGVLSAGERGVYAAATVASDWVVFPWEGSEEISSADICTRLLQFIGEDPSREGLRETPSRFSKAWAAWTEGYKINPASVLKSFEDGSQDYDQMLVQKNIPVYSHCEHHLAPFFGIAHVAYIPSKRIVGLSKLSRLVDVFAHRLQVQERMTVQIARALDEALNPKGVAVVVECRHMCMESRGVRRQGAVTKTSALHGLFRDSAAVRAEFLALIS
jgi:GTP cyclohydrolase I